MWDGWSLQNRFSSPMLVVYHQIMIQVYFKMLLHSIFCWLSRVRGSNSTTVHRHHCNELNPAAFSTPKDFNQHIFTAFSFHLYTGILVCTWFHELLVEAAPGLFALLQVLLHDLDVGKGTVAFWESGRAPAPAVVVAAEQLALWVARHIAEGCLHKTPTQKLWQDIL